MTIIHAERDQVLAFRLDSHHLSRRQTSAALLEVAGACGVRNSPPGSALLGLHARIAGLTGAAVERALAVDKTLVEVLGMRASPYLVPAHDAAVFTLGALPMDEESLRAALPSLGPTLAEAGITATDALAQSAAAAAAELADGMLLRGDLSAALTRRLPAALSPWCRACGVHHINESLFRLVGVRGVWVIAPRAGKVSVYVRADQWLGAALDGDPTAARAELLRRYLCCYGPTTAADFAGWAGISAAEARGSWAALAEQLVAVELERGRAWLHADDAARFEHPPLPVGVRLLPPYDAYLDQRDRVTLLPDTALHRSVWRVIGNPGVVLADGRLVAIWRPQKKGRRLLVTVEPFTGLSPSDRDAIEAETALLAPLRDCTSAQVAFAD